MFSECDDQWQAETDVYGAVISWHDIIKMTSVVRKNCKMHDTGVRECWSVFIYL